MHTGTQCTAVFKPAPYGRGITFYRSDIKDGEPVKAVLENVISTVRGTNLKAGQSEVFTVEHILSACAGLEITDLDVYLDAPEPPILDGSSIAFTQILRGAELFSAQEEYPNWTVKEEVVYTSGDVKYTAVPSGKTIFEFKYVTSHPLVGDQLLSIELGSDGYLKEIAPARTFGFEEELDYLRKAGLAKGGSLDNAVIIAKDKVVASGGLRYKDELVRHKLLDMIGDFSLLNAAPKNVKITAVGGGHKHNIEFCKILKQKAVFEVVKKERTALQKGETVKPEDLIGLINQSAVKEYNVDEIQTILPHRNPFLLIDKVGIISNEAFVGTKCVTSAEPWFAGHFPGKMVMPGVLILESMAQTAGVGLVHSTGIRDRIAFFLTIDKAKFRMPVVPGNMLKTLILVKRAGKISKVQAYAFNENKICCEAEMTFVSN